MNKKHLLFFGILSIIVVCTGLFYWHIQREKNYAKTREIFAPIYAYSGRLTPEEQKSLSEFTISMMEVEPSVAKKYAISRAYLINTSSHIPKESLFRRYTASPLIRGI